MSETKRALLERKATADLEDSSGVRGGSHYEAPSKEQCPVDNSDSPLHKAAYEGDVLSLKALISSCEDIDAENCYGCTPLHLAIRGNQAEAVGLLLSAGADPSLEDFIDEAMQPPHDAVYLAAWTGARHAMAALIDAGLKISGGAFERCASLNFVDCMETIIDKLSGADFSDCSRIEGIRLALGRAALCWHLEAVEFLLTRVTGFPDRNSLKDQTALGQALAAASDLEALCIDECRWFPNPNANPGRYYIIKEHLIAAGADLDIERNERFWKSIGDSDTIKVLLENGLRHDSETEEGHTPLFGLVSAENDDISLVEALIADGADINHRDGMLRTPMHAAANQATADILYQHGADLFPKDKSGLTPLHMACKHGYPDFVRFLLSKGAAVNEVVTAGRTPLFYITVTEIDGRGGLPFEPIPDSITSRLEVAKILLDHGANIHAVTADGETVLHGAARLRDTELVRYLVEHGANVHAIAANGETPLHKAARKADVETVRYLTGQGADVHVVTIGHETMLHAACAMPLSPSLPSISIVLGILLDRGVDVNARDATGATALHRLYERCTSYRCGSTETLGLVNLLLRRGADRFIPNNTGKTVLDLIEEEGMWVWDGESFLKKS